MQKQEMDTDRQQLLESQSPEMFGRSTLPTSHEHAPKDAPLSRTLFGWTSFIESRMMNDGSDHLLQSWQHFVCGAAGSISHVFLCDSGTQVLDNRHQVSLSSIPRARAIVPLLNDAHHTRCTAWILDPLEVIGPGCGGPPTIWLVTAAHCVDNFRGRNNQTPTLPGNLRIYLWGDGDTRYGPIDNAISAIHLPPAWDPLNSTFEGAAWDIALLQTSLTPEIVFQITGHYVPFTAPRQTEAELRTPAIESFEKISDPIHRRMAGGNACRGNLRHVLFQEAFISLAHDQVQEQGFEVYTQPAGTVPGSDPLEAMTMTFCCDSDNGESGSPIYHCGPLASGVCNDADVGMVAAIVSRFAPSIPGTGLLSYSAVIGPRLGHLDIRNWMSSVILGATPSPPIAAGGLWDPTRLGLGASCASNYDCLSLNCDQTLPNPECGPAREGAPCRADGDCAGGSCDLTMGVCTYPQQGANQSPCSWNSQCQSCNCIAGECFGPFP